MKLVQLLKEIKIENPTASLINIKAPDGAKEFKKLLNEPTGYLRTQYDIEIIIEGKPINVGKFYVIDDWDKHLVFKKKNIDWMSNVVNIIMDLRKAQNFKYPNIEVQIDSHDHPNAIYIAVPYDYITKAVTINGQPYPKSFYTSDDSSTLVFPTFDGRKILKKEEKNLAPLNINIIDIMSPSNIRKDIIGITHYLNMPPKNNRLPRSIKGNAEIRGKKHPFTMYLGSGMMGSSESFPYNLEIIFADTGENMDFLVDLFREHNLDYEENMVDPENYYSILLSLKPGQMNLVKYHGKTLPPDINAD
jgi:hypothetical protein